MFARNAQVTMPGTRGDDQSSGLHPFAVDQQTNGLLFQVGLFHRREPDSGPEFLSLLLEPLHQLNTVDAIWEPGEILDDAGGGQQTAGHGAGQHQRGEIGTGRVDGGSETSAAGSDDDNIFHSVAARLVRPWTLSTGGDD
jgi:hypothetical protein